MGILDRLTGRNRAQNLLFEEFQASLEENPLAEGNLGAMRLELHARQKDFLAERLPRGPEALNAAKEGGLFKIDKDFLDNDGSKEILTDAFQKAQLIHWVGPDDYGNPGEWAWKFGRRSWADVLHADNRAVKRLFEIPFEAGPQETVELLSEALITREFTQRVSKEISKPLERAFAKEQRQATREREREDQAVRKEALEASPYRAIIDEGRPVLTDIDAAAATEPARPSVGHDGPSH